MACLLACDSAMDFFKATRIRLRNAHPDHHAIAKGMFLVALFVLVGSLARAAKEVAIAYRYGVSAEVDAYLFVFNLVSWPMGVWFSILTVVLVPLVVRIRHGALAELPRFRSELLGLTMLIGVALAFIGLVGLPFLLRSSWTGLPGGTSAIAVQMVAQLSFLAAVGVITSLFSAWMLAEGRHANTLLESIPSLVILLALVAFSGGGIQPLVWGTLAGAIFHLVSLALPLARQHELGVPRLTRQSPHWTDFWQGFGIMLVGQTFMSFTGIIDQFFAAHLGTGAIATLGYANRILALILGMGAMAVSRATLPVFSQTQAEGGLQMHSVAVRWVQLLCALGVAVALVSWFLAPLGVQLLFERGAFNARDTAAVVDVFRYGLTQLPFYFSGVVLVSLFASQGRYKIIALIAILNLILKMFSAAILVPIFLINGIMISNSIMYASALLFLIFNLKVLNKK
jgi:putative peptidoglycan lipid II flippase